MESISFPQKKEFGRASDSDTQTMLEMRPELHGINEAGRIQELERNFSFLSICSVGIVTGNTWAALGGTIAVAIFNGGPPGVIYEFIVVALLYWLVAASLAELASSVPSSAGVYHWASITPGPRYGRVCGFFAGWWNFLAWVFACATISSIIANIAVAMYTIYHPDYVYYRWHTFVAYVISTWLCCSIVMFANRALPMINNLGLLFVLCGVVITIIVCAVMPTTTGTGHATSAFVWKEWSNQAGYTSDGFVFLTGMLNGAFAIGVPNCVSHLAEEIPNPKRNVPLAMASQMVIGTVTALCYLIAIFYATNSLDTVLNSTTLSIFPLAEIYLQATSSRAGCFGLLFVIFCPLFITSIGTYITAGRTFWTLARDNATPLSPIFAQISPRFENPLNATLLCGCISTCIGAINIGSATAFNAFVGAFIILSTLSYLAAILPFVLSGRFGRASHRNEGSPNSNGMVAGPFEMSQVVGYTVNIVSCAYMIVFIVIYCFPYSLPVTANNMNYASATTGALTIFVAVWWFVRGANNGAYVGPKPLAGDGEGGQVELSG